MRNVYKNTKMWYHNVKSFSLLLVRKDQDCKGEFTVMSKASIARSNGLFVLMIISLVFAFLPVPGSFVQAEAGGVVAGEGYDGVRRIYGDNGEVLLEPSRMSCSFSR